MSEPTLTPASVLSVVVLPSSGKPSEVAAGCPYGIYSKENLVYDSAGHARTNPLYSVQFLSGAAEQVAYTYSKLGGEVLDIELTKNNIYASYEEACLEYSYIVNIHQASNMLGSSLGNETGSFDHRGMLDATFDPENVEKPKISMSGKNIALKFPRFEFGYTRRVADAFGAEKVLSTATCYSASFDRVSGEQDYDLQAAVEASSYADALKLTNDESKKKRIIIDRVWYRTPAAMWRFFGYYGGLNVIGNMHSYGQFADDSSFQLIPTWQNKAQALAYEDALYTRLSHYSYEIRDNKIRIFPIPGVQSPKKFWVQFRVLNNSWEDELKSDHRADGVNNMNTLPLSNIPFNNINSIGKQWIRRFALALSKETLGQIRSKFNSVPIPGQSVTLNGATLITEGRDEQTKLRDELKKTLEELTYSKLTEQQSAISENAFKSMVKIPLDIYVG